LKYSSADKSVEANVPSDLLVSNVYHFDLVHVPTNTDNSINRNVSESTTTEISEGETSAEITTREANGIISDGEEKSFYRLDFRTSQYNKFLDKISYNQLNVTFKLYPTVDVDILGSKVPVKEGFDVFELSGKGSVDALIRREAVLESADWYQANIHSLLYKDYPFHKNAQITYRNTSDLGLPPTKDIDIWQFDYDYYLSDSDIESGKISMSAKNFKIIYGLPVSWSLDFKHLRNKLADVVAKGFNPDAKINSILKRYPCPQVSIGDYPIKLEYVLPGKNVVTSSRVIRLKNSFYNSQINMIK